MPAGIGSAAVLTAIGHGFTCLSLCTFAPISPLELQNSLLEIFFLGCVWARLRGVEVDFDRKIAASLMQGAYEGAFRPPADVTVDMPNSRA